MKKIVCEMCGSSDFAKTDGMFVCQTCGMKYSVEEAKALMVDDGNDAPVASQPAQAPQSSRLENLRILAQRAKEENDTESAEKYYREIMLEDPNDWQANFYSVFYAAHNIKIAQIGSAATSVANALPAIIKLMANNEPEEKHLLICTKLYTEITEFATMLINNANNNLSSDYSRRKEQFNNWYVPIQMMQRSFANSVFNNTHCYTLLEIAYKNLYSNCNSLKNTTYNDQFRLIANEANENLNRTRQAQEAYEQEKVNKYWNEHPEEKAQLDNEKKGLEDELTVKNEELKKINEDINNIPEKLKSKENLQKVEELKKEKAGLGLFKGKEKDALQAQIDELNGQNSRELLPAVADKEAPLKEAEKAKLAEIKEIQNKIDAVDKKLKRK